jgi:hypothetical protein
MSSMTRSVIRETVSLLVDWLTEAPCTSAKWAEVSPVVSPSAHREATTGSRSETRRWAS